MELLIVKQTGIVRTDEHRFWTELNLEYKEAMIGLRGFEYLNIFWWFDRYDNSEGKSVLTEEQSYSKGSALLETFATRPPGRLNPITFTCAQVTYPQIEKGIIGLVYLDALDQSPIPDTKPYTSSLNRVEHPGVPAWRARWPKNVEISGELDWSVEFNFQEDDLDLKDDGIGMIPQSS